jgi:hypothetical protein
MQMILTYVIYINTDQRHPPSIGSGNPFHVQTEEIKVLNNIFRLM